MKRLQKCVLLLLTFAPLLCLLASCSGGKEETQENQESQERDWVMRYGEQTLDEADYAYLMAVIKEYYNYYCQYYYGQELDAMWEKSLEDGKTFAEMLTETVNDSARTLLVVEQLCAEAGLTVDEKALAEISDYMQNLADDYGGEDAMKTELAKLGMDPSSVERYERYNHLFDLLREHRYGENGVAKISREEVWEAFRGDYAKVEGYLYNYLVTDNKGNRTEYQYDFGPDSEALAEEYFHENYVTVRHILYRDEAKAK
ncbi:MAG: hypothetical protein J1E00_06645, partial [Oscillospiraceae bacterium]|nr:hypothetical protein [Oscillospiraceae bacterium]